MQNAGGGGAITARAVNQTIAHKTTQCHAIY